jgi:hypothetical protein
LASQIWGEICDIAAEEDVSTALLRLGVISFAELPYRADVTRDWYRSGQESYSALLEVEQLGVAERLIVKACTAFGDRPLTVLFDEMLWRRSICDQAGISTPKLFGVGRATLVEEWVPYNAFEQLQQRAPGRRRDLLSALGSTAALLAKLGFVPLKVGDWRSRADDVVLIDFGQDLGPAGIGGQTEGDVLPEVLGTISSLDISLTPVEYRLLGEAYEQVLS